jgi:hypothetical protein
LSIEQQIIQYRSLNKWFQSPLGIFVANEFTHQFQLVTDYLKGEILLQLGSCGTNPWLDLLDFNHKWVLSPIIKDKNSVLNTSLNQIPLSRNSVDCVIAPLTIEPFTSSFTLIDEIDRILKPMGYVVFVSINPWSLWGGAMKCGLLSCFAEHKIKMRTSFSLNRIFLQRGYRYCALNNFCYIPPINNYKILNKLSIFNEIGKMLWPFPSGFYCYIAQKYEYISPSLIEPTGVTARIDNFKTSLQPIIN